MTTIYRLPNTDYRYKIEVPNVDTVVVGDIVGYFTDYVPVVVDLDWGGSYIDLSSFSLQDRILTIDAFDINGNVLFEDTVEIVRPYASPPSDTAEADIAVFYEKETIARTIIDNITGGFYFNRKLVSYESSGGDVIPLQDNITRILRAWENGELMFDVLNTSFINTKTFAISTDRTSIVVNSGGYVNREAGKSSKPKWSPSDYLYETYDSIDISFPYYAGTFPSGNDYVFDVEVGYKYLPTDITIATNLLIQSNQCTDQYLNRYITEYDTDQYRIKYNLAAFSGTGNYMVDSILAKYTKGSGVIKAGVL